MERATLPAPPRSLRGVPALRHLYGRRHAVIVCQDDPSELEAAVGRLGPLNTELVVEQRPGPLSALLGRPSLTVCDRYLDVGLHAETAPVAKVLQVVLGFETRCEECPQAADELRSPWAQL